uniref:Uncharacterized protein n=1 Tax=Sinocyclocheilus grahami TaxID=75366 RepID=A0A672M9F4_SINGR
MLAMDQGVVEEWLSEFKTLPETAVSSYAASLKDKGSLVPALYKVIRENYSDWIGPHILLDTLWTLLFLMGSLSPLLKYLRLPSQITSPRSHHQQPAGLLFHHVIVAFSPPQQLKSLLLLLWTLNFVPSMNLSFLQALMAFHLFTPLVLESWTLLPLISADLLS